MGGVGLPSAWGLTLMLDYSLDSAGFNTKGGGAAKAAMDQAAADISAVITSSLTALNQSDFTVGGTTVTVSHQFTNPTTGGPEDYDPEANPVAADTVLIYVGAQMLGGTTIAQGGPGSSSLSGSGTDWGLPSAQASAHQSRGGGAEIGRFQDVGGGGVDIVIGTSVGNLWFDVDTDNLGGLDNDLTLEQFWHYDHTTAPAGDKYDLYTVALHEMLHAIGIGTSNAWDNLQSGTTWSGVHAIAENGGSGANLVSGGHVALGTMSTRLSDGGSQEAVLVPSIGKGVRKELTGMDVAFLQDIGWSVPEPGVATLVLMGIVPLAMGRRRLQ